MLNLKKMTYYLLEKTWRNLSNQNDKPELVKKNKSYYMNFKHIL